MSKRQRLFIDHSFFLRLFVLDNWYIFHLLRNLNRYSHLLGWKTKYKQNYQRLPSMFNFLLVEDFGCMRVSISPIYRAHAWQNSVVSPNHLFCADSSPFASPSPCHLKKDITKHSVKNTTIIAM